MVFGNDLTPIEIQMAKAELDIMENGTEKEQKAKAKIEVRTLFDTVEIIKDVYPPAKVICVEFQKFNKADTQCIKLLTWREYVIEKYPNFIIVDMQYNYGEKLMLLYLKEVE